MYEYVNGRLTLRWTESPGNSFIVSPAATTWAAPGSHTIRYHGWWPA